MKQIQFIILGIILMVLSCQDNESVNSNTVVNKTWTIKRLNEKTIQNLDSTKWDVNQFKQDIDNYTKYADILQNYPLNNAPFPVAEYEYAVASIPFEIEKNDTIYKGIRVGEYESFESDKIINKLTLVIVTKDKDIEEVTFVVSRNYPYLTAQGYFKTLDTTFDWVFSASPDGYSTLMLNMKLFDLRFGETILIYPQIDKSFFYQQIKDSPNNYKTFEAFENVILNFKNTYY